jgi:hypothetical protein
MKILDYAVADALSRRSWQEALRILFLNFNLDPNGASSIFIEEYVARRPSVAYHDGNRIYSWTEGFGWKCSDGWTSGRPRAWIKIPKTK